MLRRRVFYRLSKLGVNYYDRELPGDVATRVVADLDRILTFVEQQAFRFASQFMIIIVALGAIIIMAPGVIPVVLGLIGLIVILTVIQLPFANRALVVVARRARCGHPQVPGRLRRPPRDPSSRCARDPDPEVRGSELGASTRALVGGHPAEHAHRDHPVPGHDDHRARALPGGQPRAEAGPQHRHRDLGRAARHHRHPAAPAARTHLQRVPRRAGVVAATVPAVRRAHPPGGRRERAAEPPSRRARHLRVGGVHLPRHRRGRCSTT